LTLFASSFTLLASALVSALTLLTLSASFICHSNWSYSSWVVRRCIFFFFCKEKYYERFMILEFISYLKKNLCVNLYKKI
jgi:hypothetical protein